MGIYVVAPGQWIDRNDDSQADESREDIQSTNLLLTAREDRTGEYWPEVVAARTEQSEVRT